MAYILGYEDYRVVKLIIETEWSQKSLSSFNTDFHYVLLDEEGKIILGESGLTNSVHYSRLKECFNDKSYREALHGSKVYSDLNYCPVHISRLHNVATEVYTPLNADYVCTNPSATDPFYALVFKNDESKDILLFPEENTFGACVGDKLVDVLLKVEQHNILNDLLNNSKSILERYANAELVHIGKTVRVGMNMTIVKALCKDKPAIVMSPLGLVDMVCSLEACSRDMTESKIDIVVEHVLSKDADSRLHALRLLYNMNYSMYPYISLYILRMFESSNSNEYSAELYAMEKALDEYKFLNTVFDNLPKGTDELTMKYFRKHIMQEATEMLHTLNAKYSIDISKYIGIVEK